MGRKRGFLAEVQHQMRLAEQKQRAAAQSNLAAQRRNEADLRRREAAKRAEERRRAAASRAEEAERKRLEREALQAYVESRLAEVDVLNEELTQQYAEIDGLLQATLDVDDFVDLETLRVNPKRPVFQFGELREPLPRPTPLKEPLPPVRPVVPKPTGLFGKKKRYEEALAAAESKFAKEFHAWQEYVSSLPRLREGQERAYASAGKKRQDDLAIRLAEYEKECKRIEDDANKQNADLDALITGLAYGTPDAVQEYVGIVLANSIYPELFPVDNTAEFDPSTAELKLHVEILGPEAIPTTKAFKYTKTSDEITSTNLSQKDSRERYANVVNAVALRSIHEIFEADRRGIIQSISLELGSNTISPATGRPTYVPFVALATSREKFDEIDLSAAVPSAVLEHLGASVSKNPFSLVAASGGGVRKV